MITGSELAEKIEWQMFAQKISSDDDPLYTVVTPVEGESIYFQSTEMNHIDIILPEKKSFKIRVRILRDPEWSRWSKFLEFKTKAYNTLYFVPDSVKQRQSRLIINTSISDVLSFDGV